MTDQTGGSLNAAYEAIKAKDLSKARDLLSTYLVEQPNDVDAWWLYSYAVTEIDQAKKALETVLRLDPAYPGARDLLNELEETMPATGAHTAPIGAKEVTALRPLSERAAGVPPLTTTINPDDDELADFGLKASSTESESSNRTLLAAIAAIVVLLILAAVFILPNLTSGPVVADVTNTAAATDTSLGFAITEEVTAQITDTVAIESTAEGTSAVEVDPTLEITAEAVVEPTMETVGDPMQVFYDALGAFEVVPDSALTESTQLGQTLAVSVCASASELRSSIPVVLAALAQSSDQAPDSAQAIGARFVNCVDNTTLRYVAIGIEDARAFAAGTIDEATLRSKFVPLS